MTLPITICNMRYHAFAKSQGYLKLPSSPSDGVLRVRATRRFTFHACV